MIYTAIVPGSIITPHTAVTNWHDEGKLFRWWGAPDTPQFKRFFIKENVDLIGADNLKALYDILNE